MPRGKQHGKATNRAKSFEQEVAVKRAFDTLEEALAADDGTAANEALQELARRSVTQVVKECERRLSKPKAESSISIVLVDLLRVLAGPKADAALRRVANNRSVPDVLRVRAKRRVGWDTSDVAISRVAFLDSLNDPQVALLELLAGGPIPDIEQLESVEEVLRYLQALPAERRLTMVRGMMDADPESFAPLASALAHVDDPRLQQVVIEWMRAYPSYGASQTLQRVADTAIDSEIRALAARTRADVVAELAAGDSLETIALPPVAAAMLSSVDAQGEQIAIIAREHAPGVVTYVQLFCDDTTGVRDIFGATSAPPDALEDLREDVALEGYGLVDVDASVVRGLFRYAVEVSTRTGHPLPPAFDLWEPGIHDAVPAAPDEAIATLELDDAAYAGRDDLVAASGELFDHDWFAGWTFSMMDTLRGMSLADRPKGKRLTNAQFEPLLEVLVDPFRRTLLRARLRRQAHALDLAGATRERDLALAVSASLRSIGMVELVEHPFLRRMTELSVAAADPLGSSELDTFGGLGGLDLFGGTGPGSLFGGFDDAWLDDLAGFVDDEDDDDEFDDDLDDDEVISAPSRVIDFPQRGEAEQ